ncbi:MAG: T9SS type A sorting domain-containing protein [Candidatus Marinimicrobia bacterium]|nr:T9SS type A sorting domain-containing protein [Candidatus Neomarinimicrobiota bacterium]
MHDPLYTREIYFTLQWATYRDASDQCSLSRIFGGIHPPADDIPGRLIGETIGIEAVQLAKKYFTGTITAVQKFDDNLPTGYVLHSNFPNPFNPVTTLKYSLPVPGKVVLTIFDLRGREIERLVNNELSAGVHTIVWDASNVASGVYFYRLQANDFTQTKKMALLK